MAGCDPLRDEGEAYAGLLQKHANRVSVRRFEGVPHPFQHMDGVLEGARSSLRMLVGLFGGPIMMRSSLMRRVHLRAISKHHTGSHPQRRAGYILFVARLASILLLLPT